MKNLFKFSIITLILVVIAVILLIAGLAAQVGENWAEYRCKPYIMPFASFYGHDSAENFQHCLQESFSQQSGQAFSPIYDILGQFSGTVGIMVETANGMRQLLGNFMTTTRSFVGNVKSKIEALMFQVRMSFLKMQTLMNRVYGTMYSIIWMGTSALTAGTNLADNDLVSFLFEFCFHPDTLVKMSDGSTKRIEEIEVGEAVFGGHRVTSTFRFNGIQTPMVRIRKTIMSSQHLIQLPNGEWSAAKNHPKALPVPPTRELICMNVEGHRFVTADDLVVGDYDESDAAAAVVGAQALAEGALNGAAAGAEDEAEDEAESGSIAYSLGVHPDAEVCLHNHTWKPLHEVDVGDKLYGGIEVLGTVAEVTTHVCTVDDIQMTPAQLVWMDKEACWKRARSISSAWKVTAPTVFRQLFLSTVGPICVRRGENELWIRDYREAPIPEMEDVYMEEVCRRHT